MPEDSHYRYCFSCEQWKTKEQINEIDAGPQPGGNNGISYNCNVCRKDLGDQIQIFRCPKHNAEILKVWGTCEGENKEKIFFDKCPQEKQEKQLPNRPKLLNPLTIFCLAIVGLVLVVGLAVVIKNEWWDKRKNGKRT